MLLNISELQLTSATFYIASTATIVYIISAVVSTIRSSFKASHFARIAKKKREIRDKQIRDINLPHINISTQLKEKILNSDATGLLEMLNSKEATSEEMLITYFQRAITIGLEHQLITELNFTESLSRARECDRLRREDPSACKGILFGLPMTIKDNLILKGTDTSGGIACRLFDPAPEDGLLAKILKREGAIIYLKSNVPQAILCNDSNNNIWGQAKNPWDKQRSVGGSSGGEGGLLASRCSPLGIGNDLGGSVRIPASCCGIVGFKPDSDRVTRAGTMEMQNIMDGLTNVRLATGPLCKSVRDANLLMKALLNSDAHNTSKFTERDPYYVRQEWQESKVQQNPKGQRIGYFKSLDLFAASPANQRAVDEAVVHLRNKGYEVIPIKFPNIDDIYLLLVESLSAEGGSRFLDDSLRGEKPISAFATLKAMSFIPNFMIPLARILLKAIGEKRPAYLLSKFRKKDAYEYLHMVARQNTAAKKFFKVWEDNKLDALLCPGLGMPAQKITTTKDLTLVIAYAMLYNVLNMPAGVIPVTVVKKGEDQYPKEITSYHDMIHKAAVASMEGSVGMPISVQIATLPHEDEKCVGIMLDLESEVRFRDNHPFPV